MRLVPERWMKIAIGLIQDMSLVLEIPCTRPLGYHLVSNYEAHDIEYTNDGSEQRDE